MADVTRSIIQEGIRAPCPLQIRSKAAAYIAIDELELDSDFSPMTTGPSSAASSTPSEPADDNDDNIELVFPDCNRSYWLYHQATFSKKQASATLSSISEEEVPVVIGDAIKIYEEDGNDDPVEAERIIKQNQLTDHLFAAVCPWNLNETSVFVYGQLASPHLLAELLANNARHRVYEQAARMFPAEVRGYAMATIGNTSVATIVPQEGSSVQGFVLFSTSIRERAIIKENRGKAFLPLETQAAVSVSGREVSVPVLTTIATNEWMEHAVLA